MDIRVGCELQYETTSATAFIFQVEAVRADGQNIIEERLGLPRGSKFDASVDPITHNRMIRSVLGPGLIKIRYESLVQTAGLADAAFDVAEIDFMDLPGEALPFLAPSRYCPSDTFTEFSFATFGHVAFGHPRVTAICDWIYSNVRYQAGSTGPNSSAADVFHSGAGVCRDFAHLGIALCRALGIPARYTSVYAVGLVPQDFHATFQAYLRGPNGGAWYTFDPTRMSSVDAVVRIAAGRDAADVAFAWPQAPVKLSHLEVWAHTKDRAQNTLTNDAIPTVQS
jgi:transglutaminase-like putative cysteine protease